MKNASVAILITFLVFGTACGPLEAVKDQVALTDVDSGEKIASERPQCEVDYDEYEINAHILSFEVFGKQGAKLGFDFSGFFKFVGLEFQTEKGRMTMSMSASDTIKLEDPVAYIHGQGEMSKNSFKFDIGLSKIGLGYEFFKQTPLSELSLRTVKDSLKKLESELDVAGVGWRSKLVYVNTISGIMPVGTSSGVKVGDRFKLSNVNYYWSDQKRPCSSELLMVAPTTRAPLAEAIAVQVENNATLLQIENSTSEESLVVGARVEISQLFGTEKELKNRKLFRPARIGLVQSQPIVFNEQTKIDLMIPVAEQIKATMDQHRFHPTN